MRRGVPLRLLAFPAAVLLVLAAACGDDDASSTPTPTPLATTAEAAETAFDLTFSSALEAEWATGDDGSGISCGLVEDGRIEIGIFGLIEGGTYGLSIRQALITNGPFVYPTSAPPSPLVSEVPFVQLSAAGGYTVWTADAEGNGSGSSVVSGEGSVVTIELDVDLTASGGVAPVHLSGEVTCGEDSG